MQTRVRMQVHTSHHPMLPLTQVSKSSLAFTIQSQSLLLGEHFPGSYIHKYPFPALEFWSGYSPIYNLAMCLYLLDIFSHVSNFYSHLIILAYIFTFFSTSQMNLVVVVIYLLTITVLHLESDYVEVTTGSVTLCCTLIYPCWKTD